MPRTTLFIKSILLTLFVCIVFTPISVMAETANRADFEMQKQYYFAAKKAREQGNYQEAISNYQKMIPLELSDRKVSELYFFVAYCYYKLGDCDNTISNCNKAIELQPYESLYYIVLGGAYEDSDDSDKAISCYQKAMELNPSDPAGAACLASFYIQNKNWLEVVEICSNWIKRNPQGNTKIYVERAIAYSSLGHGTEAAQDCKKAIALSKKEGDREYGEMAQKMYDVTLKYSKSLMTEDEYQTFLKQVQGNLQKNKGV